MRSTWKKIALANETHRLAPRHRKLQPELEPDNSEGGHYTLRVFVHFAIPYAGQMSQNHHICIIRLAVKSCTVQLPKKIFHQACQKFWGGTTFPAGAVNCAAAWLLPTITTGCSPGRT
jgi:hypothetical protein